jgi:undecaprenyl pyrophosphate phosphatase UppP
MEQSVGHEDSRLPLQKVSWEDTVYGIGLVQGCQVFPGQSWSVYTILSAALPGVWFNIHIKAVNSPIKA